MRRWLRQIFRIFHTTQETSSNPENTRPEMKSFHMGVLYYAHDPGQKRVLQDDGCHMCVEINVCVHGRGGTCINSLLYRSVELCFQNITKKRSSKRGCKKTEYFVQAQATEPSWWQSTRYDARHRECPLYIPRYSALSRCGRGAPPTSLQNVN